MKKFLTMVCAMCLLLTVFMPLAEAVQPRALVCPEGHNGTMIITRYTEWEPAGSEKNILMGLGGLSIGIQDACICNVQPLVLIRNILISTNRVIGNSLDIEIVV